MTDNSEQLEQELKRIEDQSEGMDPLQEILNNVPPNAPKATLPAILGPLWEALYADKGSSASLYIDNNIREYFGLNKAEMKPFHRAYNIQKLSLDRKKNEIEKSSKRVTLLDRDINSSEVLDSIEKIGIVDRNVFELVTATYVASILRTIPPIWLMLVGVPSSFKTELVGLIDLPEIYSLDTLSENAFASGYVMPDGSDPDDLLPLLDGKCFVIKDLTTIFSLKEDTVKKILGDLTSIFDGKYEKFTATRGNISYCSQFSLISCITPAILSKHHRYMHQLGGRFFFLRIPDLSTEMLKRGQEIAWDASDRAERIQEARRLMSTYCHQVAHRASELYTKIGKEGDEVQRWINAAADFISRARGTTVTKSISFENDQKERITYDEITDPQIEQPWRILNQLRSLARTLAAMRGKTTVTSEELETLKPIVISSMPIDRAVVIEELLKDDHLQAKELAERIRKSVKTARRNLCELEALGLIETDEVKDPNTGYTSKWHSLKSDYKEFLTEIGG